MERLYFIEEVMFTMTGVVIAIICAMFYYANYKNKFFERHGIITTRNPLPFFGHMFRVFAGKEHLLQTIFRAYKSHPDEKFFGFYAFNKPIIVLKDLDVIKKVTVKDFDHFLDHKVFFDEEDEPLFGRNLFFLRGQKWKDMRIAMSPAYTASKMKNMLPFVAECAEKTVQYFKEELKSEHLLQIEMKDVFTRFTNDVIASTAFGIQVNSFQEKENDFYIMGKKATNFSGVQFLKFFGYSSCPGLMKLFGIPLFPTSVKSFFRKVVRDAMDTRETTKHIRPDMIHLLMLAKKGSLSYDNDSNNMEDTDFAAYKEASKQEANNKREWTHDDLTAQAVAFLLAGFDTSSTLLCFTAYELAKHPAIQQRLQEEIDFVNISTDRKMTYLELNKMKYMDMVVSESLRMWPPDSLLERVCTKSYTMPPQNDFTSVKYQMNKGDDIMIPTYSIHHDPKNHPDPEVFNPERFSDENKPFMSPFSFIPFGVGPRTCIGARFAVMEAKVMLYYLLSTFDIVVTPKTAIPINLATDTFTLNSTDGFWLGLRPRKQK